MVFKRAKIPALFTPSEKLNRSERALTNIAAIQAIGQKNQARALKKGLFFI
jgi:hypothetical protein